MRKSTPTPKFIIISSGGGSLEIGAAMASGGPAYGASKAAANYLTRKLHFEHPELGERFLLRPSTSGQPRA